MRKPLVLIAILLCVSEASANGAITGQVVKSGLNSPAAFTFDPSGRIFYGELKRGRVHILNPVTGADTIFYTVPNIETAGGEQGLLGGLQNQWLLLMTDMLKQSYCPVVSCGSLGGTILATFGSPQVPLTA